MDIAAIMNALSEDLDILSFSPPVSYVYNPLAYAREPFLIYLNRYGTGRKKAIFLGMNPGPWGMAQTGIPFGEINSVTEWLKIRGEVGHPRREHPKKRVTGFSCRRSEVSGRRLWGLFSTIFPDPHQFFERYFVYNYCPLLFLDVQGRNITPDALSPACRETLFATCDRSFRRVAELLRPETVIGVGNFAADRAVASLAGTGIAVGKILHPSPANPHANSGWDAIVLEQLRTQGIFLVEPGLSEAGAVASGETDKRIPAKGK